ncbi:MAG: NADH-quinone oxidoreductase subunit J [Paraprevotella sp.]|nr:NADH-quinone oxidoreductase subunit J [Paraprevotella sp.]
MEITLQEVVFGIIALMMAVCSVLAVTSGKILRAATALLFVLFGTSVLYFMLGYTYLGAVQLSVYAGGIVVLYVFSILLTRSDKNMNERIPRGRWFAAAVTVLVGFVLTLFLLFTNGFALNSIPALQELDPETVGKALIGMGKYQFVLPFEVVSVLLLACMIGAIMIARKR